MKKLILILCVMVSINADELVVSNPTVNPASKLERIQLKIDKYTKIINQLPAELEGKIKNFERLQGLGTKIEKVLTTYIVAVDECIKESHSALGEEACEDMSNLDLGTEIKKEKRLVLDMIEEAQRELTNVRAKEKDIPMVKKILNTLITTKKMLMREEY